MDMKYQRLNRYFFYYYYNYYWLPVIHLRNLQYYFLLVLLLLLLNCYLIPVPTRLRHTRCKLKLRVLRATVKTSSSNGLFNFPLVDEIFLYGLGSALLRSNSRFPTILRGRWLEWRAGGGRKTRITAAFVDSTGSVRLSNFNAVRPPVCRPFWI